jgi:sodium transport system permease protein
MMFLAIARKELREAMRDRRSLGSGLIYGLWGPMVMGMALVAMAGHQGDVGALTIETEGAARAPGLVAYLAGRDVTAADARGDVAAAVRERRLPVGLIIRADYPATFDGSRPAPVELLHDTTWTESARQSAHVRAVLGDYARSVGDTRLVLRGVAPTAVQPLRIHERDFATAGDRAARMLATMPIFVLLAAFIGGLGVAADMAAGERERGSLESLLLHPVSRLAIVGGKWLSVSLVAIATVALALVVTVGVMRHPRVQDIDLPIGLSPLDTLYVLLMLVPLAVLASAVQLWIAFQARTYKEAQTKLSTLIFVPMIPGFLFAFGSIEPAPWMTFTPMIGQHVMLTSLVRGEAPALAHLASLSVITMAAGAAAWLAAAHQLGRESVLRRTSG